jgi:hypothetical protein
MHSKRKGNIGQLGIGLELSKLGYSVFTEEGDISKIDIIAEKDGTLIRIQSKAITPVNDTIELILVKAGPNYKFKYKSNNFDYFGVWDLEDHKAYLISADILNKHNKSLKLRKTPAKNNQQKNTHMLSDYAIGKILSS